MKLIDEKLNIGELIKPEKDQELKVVEEQKPRDLGDMEGDQEEFDGDFDKSLDILEETLETARNSLEHIVEIAKQEESPKAFDSVTNLLRTMNQTAKLMLEMHEKKQKYKHNNIKLKENGPKETGSSPTVNNTQINNNLYMGTTQELDDIASEIPEIKALREKNQKNPSN